jgi:nucleosome assembly protein 1-like 1
MTSQAEEQTKRRLNALRNIQLKIQDVESSFLEELFKLEKKFTTIYGPLYDQRANIISGKHEPNDDEATWAYNTQLPNLAEPSVNGIDNFWLDILKSSSVILDKIQDHDEPILKHLTDVRCKINDQVPLGYTIEFYFSENDYFTNKVLSKSYELISQRDKDDPFKYENGTLYRSVGCQIDWKEGKNVTVKIIKKKQTNKNDSTISRVVTHEEKQDSFFIFFETRTSDGIRPVFKQNENKTVDEANKISHQNEDAEDPWTGLDENSDHLIEQLFEIDYQIGQLLKENLIPKALFYFTGELTAEVDEDDEEYDDENDDDDNDDDDDEDEEESEEEVKNVKNPRKKNKV